MHSKKLFLLLLPALGCTAVTTATRSSEKDLYSYYDHERDVAQMVANSDTKDPQTWWTENAVRKLEEERLQTTGDLIAACLHSTPGDSFSLKGRPKPDNLYANDLQFYDAMVQSNNRIADRYVEVRALIDVAEKQYSHKDEFKALALRGLIAYERLLDHHRFILRQIAAYDCLSNQAPLDVKFEEEALKSLQIMVKNLKRSGEMLGEMQTMVDQEYDRLAKPLADRRPYASRLDVYGFMHRVFGDNTEEVERECRTLGPDAKNYAFKAFACGYVAEKGGHDSKAAKFYAEAKRSGIEYAGPAAKRTSYLEDWNSPLQTDESRRAEGQSNYQVFVEFK